MRAKNIVRYIDCSLKYHKDLSEFTINVLTQVKKHLKKYKGYVSFWYMRTLLQDIAIDCGNKPVSMLEQVIITGILNEILIEETIVNYEQMKKH